MDSKSRMEGFFEQSRNVNKDLKDCISAVRKDTRPYLTDKLFEGEMIPSVRIQDCGKFVPTLDSFHRMVKKINDIIDWIKGVRGFIDYLQIKEQALSRYPEGGRIEDHVAALAKRVDALEEKTEICKTCKEMAEKHGIIRRPGVKGTHLYPDGGLFGDVINGQEKRLNPENPKECKHELVHVKLGIGDHKIFFCNKCMAKFVLVDNAFKGGTE